MSRFVGIGSLLLATALGATSAFAQEGEGFSPSNDELNRDLDESLKREYTDDHPPPPTEGAPPAADKKKKRDRFKITLGMMGAYYHSQLFDVEVSYREGLSGGQPVLFNHRDFHDYNQDSQFELEEGAGTYRAWIDFGKHIAITGGFRHVRYENAGYLTNAELPSGGGFTFGPSSFQIGDRLETEFDMMIADSDFVFRPLNNKWVTIDMSIGARYISWETTFRRTNGPANEVSSKIEGAMPMVGLGLAIRPVSVFEIFGRVRIGGLDYEVDTNDYDSDEIEEYDIENKEREMRSYEFDVGIRFIFGDHVGLILGYRLDYIELQRRVDSRDESVEAKSHGAYGGLILQF